MEKKNVVLAIKHCIGYGHALWMRLLSLMMIQMVMCQLKVTDFWKYGVNVAIVKIMHWLKDKKSPRNL